MAHVLNDSMAGRHWLAAVALDSLEFCGPRCRHAHKVHRWGAVHVRRVLKTRADVLF